MIIKSNNYELFSRYQKINYYNFKSVLEPLITP
jgi:hypothetical protein